MPVQPARLAGLGSILEILIGTAKLKTSILKAASEKYDLALPTIPSIGSPIYCRGTSPLNNKCPLNYLSGRLYCHTATVETKRLH